MLNILHKKINEIVPIISIEENNGIIIQYKDPDSVTTEQNTIINTILANWPFDKLKLIKLQQLDTNWLNNIKSGYITQYGWKLGLETNDVTLLTGAFLLAKEASSNGLLNQATIMDTEGVSHIMSINDFTILMLSYGEYRSNLSYNYSTTKQLIEQATTQQDLDNIII